jgi:hypothetical protein
VVPGAVGLPGDSLLVRRVLLCFLVFGRSIWFRNCAQNAHIVYKKVVLLACRGWRRKEERIGPGILS